MKNLGEKERGSFKINTSLISYRTIFSIALRHFFVENNLLSGSLVDSLQKAKVLREDADYRGKYSKDTALEVLENAKRFYDEGKKILESK